MRAEWQLVSWRAFLPKPTYEARLPPGLVWPKSRSFFFGAVQESPSRRGCYVAAPKRRGPDLHSRRRGRRAS